MLGNPILDNVLLVKVNLFEISIVWPAADVGTASIFPSKIYANGCVYVAELANAADADGHAENEPQLAVKEDIFDGALVPHSRKIGSELPRTLAGAEAL